VSYGWRLVFSFFLFVCFVVAVFVFNTISHEEAHREIARHNGCVEWTIEYHLFESSFFRCLERNESKRIYSREEYLADSYNEVVGYNVISVLLGMFACTLFLWITRI